MYDPITTALLFILVAPGFVLTLPPGGSPLLVVLVHAVVFWALQTYVSLFVPWWGIWAAVGAIVAMKLYRGGASSPASPY